MPDMSDVHRSDILRWRLLSTVGGVWSDMDILFTKPMDKLSCNVEANRPARTYLCWWGAITPHRIGFLMSTPSNPFFMAIHDMALASIHPGGYQSGGSELLNMLGISDGNGVVNMERDTVYPLHAEQIFDFSSTRYEFKRSTVGVHWYAGHPLAARYMMDNKPRCIIDKL